jgi:hypothetical protein
MTYAATTAGFAILEVAICALVLASIEGKRIVNILKGEF